jgi:serine/threonine protein kinase
VWSAGVLLYAVLNMAYPWPKEWPAVERWQAMHARPLNYSAGAAAWLTDDCKNLLEQMLHPDPAQRITIEGIKQHPWFRVDLDPALMGIKDACMGLPSPCVLTPAQLSALVAQVQETLQPALHNVAADALPASPPAPNHHHQQGLQLQQLLAAVVAKYDCSARRHA